jgi:hypothetical protein
MEGGIGSQSPQRTVVFEEKGKNDKEEKERKTKTKKKTTNRKKFKITDYCRLPTYHAVQSGSQLQHFEDKK